MLENLDYKCHHLKSRFISAQLTLQQAEGLKEDMKDFIVKVALDYDSDDTRLGALSGMDSRIRRRLEAIVLR